MRLRIRLAVFLDLTKGHVDVLDDDLLDFVRGMTSPMTAIEFVATIFIPTRVRGPDSSSSSWSVSVCSKRIDPIVIRLIDPVVTVCAHDLFLQDEQDTAQLESPARRAKGRLPTRLVIALGCLFAAFATKATVRRGSVHPRARSLVRIDERAPHAFLRRTDRG